MSSVHSEPYGVAALILSTGTALLLLFANDPLTVTPRPAPVSASAPIPPVELPPCGAMPEWDCCSPRGEESLPACRSAWACAEGSVTVEQGQCLPLEEDVGVSRP